MDRYFIITVDTEGDNLWEPVIKPGGMREITVKNAAYIERFQMLCEKYHFIPTYLVDYEMAEAEPFAGMAKERLKDGKCEIGMHMHAWSTPPYFHIKYRRNSNNPYAGDYPRSAMWEKMKLMTHLLGGKFGIRPASHRGGRWYIDPWYICALRKLGYKADCSVTPGISWEWHIGHKCYGNDYTKYPDKAYYMNGRHLHRKKKDGILEVPMTIQDYPAGRIIRDALKNPSGCREIMARKMWLRPDGQNLEDMLAIVSRAEKHKRDYIEFMIHSSELMPGGSPKFKSVQSIEKMYRDLEIVFERIGNSYNGVSLAGYAQKWGGG